MTAIVYADPDVDAMAYVPGDTVTYTSGSHGWSRIICCKTSTVERLTPTQLILADGTRFHRSNGRMVGHWEQKLVHPASWIAVHSHVYAERRRFFSALDELRRMKAETPKDFTLYLERLITAAEASKERLGTLLEQVSAANGGAS